MIDPTEPDSLPGIDRAAPACVKYVGKVGSVFRAWIERLYAAHNEKVQMRLAPTNQNHPEHFTSRDLPPHWISPKQ